MGKITGITLSLLIVLALAAIYLTNVYQSAMSQKNAWHDKAAAIAKEKANLNSVQAVETFSGQTQTFVVTGKDRNNSPVAVWVPANGKDPVLVRKLSDGITKDAAVSITKKESNPKEIISAGLAEAENIPCWEIKYVDKYNRYTYEYVDFVKGTIIKQIAIK
ncbi:DUF5590 domain-containing protein [Metabacillus sp. GX 13764]|uniref:cell wall elongation regulator TseB-like domain-containing protein n=1 Tax=Metabacillus kandeliae TaxID=2900151 RepID=UPI001E2CE1CF|nr:DUF5590 domain-containing protein [Metabacillus kandeliae]MCD7033398.1 DUF5590 domain-containing protein [Metabacillus kandeliae]